MDNEVQGTPGWPLPSLRTNEDPRHYTGKGRIEETMVSPLNEIGGSVNTIRSFRTRTRLPQVSQSPFLKKPWGTGLKLDKFHGFTALEGIPFIHRELESSTARH